MPLRSAPGLTGTPPSPEAACAPRTQYREKPRAPSWVRRAPLAVVLAVMLFLAVTLFFYVGRMPLFYEEPRRAIVAQEMLLSGDYVAPTVFQRPYFKKPPFHNWLIALTALPTGTVDPRAARGISIAALLSLGAAVYALLRRAHPELTAAAALMTLTNYLMACEYGNLAELDMLLTLLTFLSYAFYMRQPMRPLSFLLSALCMGLGILTKGVSPIFFYPGMAIWTLTGGAGSRGKGIGLLALHLLLALSLPAAWAGALWMRGDLGALMNTGVAEVASKTTGAWTRFFTHLAAYPLKVAIVMLPWSAAVACAWRRAVAPGRLYRSSLWIGLTALAGFTLASGSRDRYILPAIPFLAIAAAHHFDGERLVPRLAGRLLLGFLALFSLTLSVIGIRMGYFLQAAVVAAAAGVAIALMRHRLRHVEIALVTALIVITVYMHAVYHYRAVHEGDYEALAQRIGAQVRADVPLVIDEHVPLIHLVFYLESELRRPVYGRGVADFDHFYFITTPQRADSSGRTTMTLPYPRKKIGSIVVQEIGAGVKPRSEDVRAPDAGGSGEFNATPPASALPPAR